ncbi:hypothetical_protein [Leishmania infantum]|uniref:Hypothetical_protein n=1 Tax=Leishmania infantum TaxID=5671 RepID=A0A6L0XIJ7_LEIIN|nr:hypothetical_protein [Leishmania infantum]SUZ43523.1 hypothetical_protein [Leishmania infantum]
MGVYRGSSFSGPTKKWMASEGRRRRTRSKRHLMGTCPAWDQDGGSRTLQASPFQVPIPVELRPLFSLQADTGRILQLQCPTDGFECEVWN